VGYEKNHRPGIHETTRPQYLGNVATGHGGPHRRWNCPYLQEAKLIGLPNPKKIRLYRSTCRSAIERRRSIRLYNDRPISQDELSVLLLADPRGETRDRTGQRRRATYHRPARGIHLRLSYWSTASKGWRLAFTVLRPSITPWLRSTSIRKLLKRFPTPASRQAHVRGSAVSFFWAAFVERMTWRYVERGYRYMLLDAGHVCQNLYLASQTVNCVASAIGSFIDDDLKPLAWTGR